MLDRRTFLLGAATLTMAAGRAVAAPNDAIGSGFTLNETMRSELLQDAKAAWCYFERAGGAPNIWHEGNKFGSYDIASMWIRVNGEQARARQKNPTVAVVVPYGVIQWSA